MEKVVGPVDYKISLLRDPRKTKVVHVDDLKKYERTHPQDLRGPGDNQQPLSAVEPPQDQDDPATRDKVVLYDDVPDDTEDDLEDLCGADSPVPDEDLSQDADSEASEEEDEPGRGETRRARRPPNRLGSWVTEIQAQGDQL